MTALPPPTGGPGLTETEPAAVAGTITAVAAAVLGVVVAVVDVPEDLRTALLVLIGAVSPIITGVIVRGRVTPIDRR